MNKLPLSDRAAAGQALADKLARYHSREDVIILALPRGGVPVAYEIALALHLPLDVLVVRKVAVPAHPEFAMGAIAAGGIRIINEQTLRACNISDEQFEQFAQLELPELRRREKVYCGERAPLTLNDKCVIIVDDGLATGATMRAGIEAARRAGARKVVMAVPVGSLQTVNELAQWTDESIWVAAPDPFHAVSQWYKNFDQVSDEEVQRLLAQARAHQTGEETQFIQLSRADSPSFIHPVK